MNDYISFLCTLLNIKIPKVYFKANDKVYDLKHKPVNKELFQALFSCFQVPGLFHLLKVR